jgi:RHS repeat-associated protein
VVSEGTTTETLSYDTEHARVRQVTVVGGVSTNTVYLNDPSANVMTEVSRTGTNATQWKSYILADGHIVAQRLTSSGTSPQMRYFVLDHLGSVSVVTDETGAVVTDGRQSYDAWGKERNLDGSPDTTCSLPAQSATTRGFTSQEEIPAVCLVNFNARLYDPQLGRFMSADSVVQNPYDAQSLNRYTYVVNNPLSETDPTGNCHGLLECVGDGMVDASFPLMAMRPLLRTYPAIGSVIEIAAAIACESPICGAAVAGEIGGITSGDVGAGFKAFALTYAEGAAFEGVGDLTYDSGSQLFDGLERAGAHGFVGGIFSMAGGGRFGSGFLAAAFSQLASPDPNTAGYYGTIQAAAAGGIGSILGGGKFADGAVTGAFGYLFNAWKHSGIGPVNQGAAAARQAEIDLEADGYKIISATPRWVFTTAGLRIYDLLVYDPDDKVYLGVEVKSSRGEIINLNLNQVIKDFAVIKYGGYAPALNLVVKGVEYLCYCGAKEGAIAPATLVTALKALNVPMKMTSDSQFAPRP